MTFASGIIPKVTNDENGISNITILNSNNEIVKSITLDGVTKYSEMLDITNSGTYTVEVITTTGKTKQMSFEI